jgi:hypothetical protein
MDTPAIDLMRALEIARGFARAPRSLGPPKYRIARVDYARMQAEDDLPLDRWADDGGAS